mmetsp:Transcript_30945/g.62777  ORF Transcript_30945/g.62777 Transcript_30945/m.62777 type:complete len:203 (+) Transcript_30945:1116-1724(+)
MQTQQAALRRRGGRARGGASGPAGPACPGSPAASLWSDFRCRRRDWGHTRPCRQPLTLRGRCRRARPRPARPAPPESPPSPPAPGPAALPRFAAPGTSPSTGQQTCRRRQKRCLRPECSPRRRVHHRRRSAGAGSRSRRPPRAGPPRRRPAPWPPPPAASALARALAAARGSRCAPAARRARPPTASGAWCPCRGPRAAAPP